MLSTVMGILTVIYGILLCFIVIPHGAFFKRSKHFFMDGIVNSFFTGFFLAMFTITFWYAAVIILMLIAIAVIRKSNNFVGKIVVVGMCAVLAVIIAVVGIQIRRRS